MEVMNPCLCCLQRPAEKNIKTPYSCLGITEIYADMIEGCFVIQLLLENPNDDGICEVCVGRLRDASVFKLQVQRSQAELQERLERAQQDKVNVTPKPEVTEDERCNSLISSSDEKPPVKCEAEATGGGADDDDLISHNESEDIAVKSEFSDDGNDENGENGDCISLSCQDVGCSRQSGSEQAVFARVRQQLAMACSVRLERLRDDKAPRARRTSRDTLEHAASLASRASHAQGHGTGPSDTRTYTCAPCGKRFARKTTLIKHLREHMMQTQDQTGVNPLECETSKKQLTQKMNSMRHRRIHTGGKVCTCDICKAAFARKNRTHVGQKYSCEVCSNMFGTKACLMPLVHSQIRTGDKSYICDICKKGFTLKKYLRKHISTHMGRKYSCEICSITFVTKARLALHRRFHAGEESYTCDICKKGFKTKNNLRKHISSHMRQKYSCDICSKSFGTQSRLALHRQIHTREKSYTCDVCEMGFETKNNLRKHISTHMRQKYPCDACSETFGTKACLTLHRRIHAGENPYTCDICGKGFAIKKYLRNHIRRHMLQKIECGVCSETFVTMRCLTVHREIHTGKKALSEEGPHFGHDDIAALAGPTSRDTLEHAASLASRASHAHGDRCGASDQAGSKPCNICGKQITRKHYARHIRTHTKTHARDAHGDRCGARNQADSKLCNICGKQISRKHFARHSRTHTKINRYQLKNKLSFVKPKIICEVCGKQFARNSQLKKHIEIHSGLKPYSCDLCKKSYAQKSALMTHKKVHTGDKPHSCQYCDKKFLTRTEVTKHHRVHTGEQPYSCQICDMKFKAADSVTNHLRTHTGEKPFSCDVCNKKFAQRHTLALHKRVHTADKPFSCDECHQRFRYKTDYALHLVTHGVKAFTCDVCSKQFAHQRYLNLHVKNMHTDLKASRKVNKNKSDESLKNSRQAVNDRFICDLCQKSFSTKYYVCKHIRKQHMGMKLISCEICKKQFTSYSGLWLHKLVHTGDKPVACQDPNGNAITN